MTARGWRVIRVLPAACLAALVLAVAPGAALAAAGELDGSYGTGGVFTGPFQTSQPSEQFAAVDSQRRTVIAATHVDSQGRSHLDVMRLTPQGTLDTSFNPGGNPPGIVEVDFSAGVGSRDVLARGVAVASGDEVVALGWVHDPGNGNLFTALVRLGSDGSYDPTFGANDDGRAVDLRNPNWTSSPSSLAIDSAGRILVGGSCGSGCGGFVARYTTSGAPDTGGFDASSSHPGVLVIGDASDVPSLAPLSGGGVLVAGGISPTDDAVIARVGSDGMLDPTFGSGGAAPGVVESGMGRQAGQTSVASARGVAPGPGGSVYVTGQVVDNGSSMRLLRLTSTGAPDPGFGTGSPATGVVSLPVAGARGSSVAVDGSSCPVAVGSATVPGQSGSAVLAARLTPAGQLDQAFNPAGPTPGTTLVAVGDSAFGQTVALQDDGNIVLGGYRQQGTTPVDRRAVALRLEGGGCGGGTPAPSVVTGQPTGITSDGATFNGTVNPNGSQVTDCHFDYGNTQQYNARVPCSPSPGAGTSPVAVSATLTGLGSGKTWNYRLVATGPGGTITGGNQTLTTALSLSPTTVPSFQHWRSTSGVSISVPGGATGEDDEIEVNGSSAFPQTGTVTFRLYSDVACTHLVFGPDTKAVVPVAPGTSDAISDPVTQQLAPGTYRWTVSYSGDGANLPSTSPCGSEALTVFVPLITGPALTNGSVVTLALSCPVICRARITLTVSALLAADARGKAKHKPPVITLARGQVTIRKHGAQKVTLRLTSAGRRFIATHGGRVTATATIAMTLNGHTSVVKRHLTLKVAKPGNRQQRRRA